MNTLKILDVTLRDGGCVNNFDFGTEYMKIILSAQEQAGIDIIELGYIDEKNGSDSGRTQYINETVIPECILHKKKPNTIYTAMIDYGKFNIDNLQPKTEEGIDGIRMAFHKKNYKDIVNLGRKIMEKGYYFYIQPMITFRYSDAELLDLINIVNNNLSDASAFYIVDSFGEMYPNDLNRILNLVDHNLVGSMPIGLHSHNNLQMSYSNACEMLQFVTNRDIVLDCSIMGMGKGAGNLNTELLIEHVNRFYNKSYNIQPLLEVIDRVINQLKDEYHWGYAVEYYLSSINGCTPSYAGHFYNKHMLPVDQVNELLSMIADEKKISFDKVYAEERYREFNNKNPIDDTACVNKLNNICKGKTILLVAPGKSVLDAVDRIYSLMERDDVVSIGLNSTLNVEFDFVLTTRNDIYEKMKKNDKPVIVPSSIVRNSDSDNVFVLDYNSWIEVDERTHDSSAVIALNLMKNCDVLEVLLAGFDGFSVNINENYYDPNLRHPVSVEQQKRRNAYYKDLIFRIREGGTSIKFITPSKYEDCNYD